MGKYKLKFELQGLKFEVEGDREDAPEVAREIGNRVAGILEAADIAEPQHVSSGPVISMDNGAGKNRRKPVRRAAPLISNGSGPEVVDWAHNPDKWGNPKQDWTTLQKSIWLIYVASQEAGVPDLSAPGLAATFNKHFRQAGTIRPQNVSRDLGAAKGRAKPVVGEDTTKSPARWFLTDAGREVAQTLIAEAKGS